VSFRTDAGEGVMEGAKVDPSCKSWQPVGIQSESQVIINGGQARTEGIWSTREGKIKNREVDTNGFSEGRGGAGHGHGKPVLRLHRRV